MIINSETHPNIIEAMNCIDDETWSYGGLKPPVREVPDRWKDYLANVDATLGKLSRTTRDERLEPLPPHVKPNTSLDNDFYEFCNGEYNDMLILINQDVNYTEASLFLNDYFEDWVLTADNAKQEPGNMTRMARLEYIYTQEKESSDGLPDALFDEKLQLESALV